MRKIIGSIMVIVSLAVIPVGAYAVDASNNTSVKINQDGIIRVIGAEVTSVTGNVINAITRFKNNMLTWTFNTNATSTNYVNNSLAATTSDVRIGDKINVRGSLASMGSAISVNATKVKDVTITKSSKTYSGVVQSVNVVNNTFVLKYEGNRTIVVESNASTTFLGLNESTTTPSLIPLKSRVKVSGMVNADKSVITAKIISVKKIDSNNDGKWDKRDKKVSEQNKKSNKENHIGQLKTKFLASWDKNR